VLGDDGHASSTCADTDLLGVMLLQDLCVCWCCRDWITVTPSLHDSQRQHWPIAASLARRRPTCPELTPARPRDARSSGTALAVSLAEDRVQAVLISSEDTARPFAKVPQRPVDPRC